MGPVAMIKGQVFYVYGNWKVFGFFVTICDSKGEYCIIVS